MNPDCGRNQSLIPKIASVPETYFDRPPKIFVGGEDETSLNVIHIRNDGIEFFVVLFRDIFIQYKIFAIVKTSSHLCMCKVHFFVRPACKTQLVSWQALGKFFPILFSVKGVPNGSSVCPPLKWVRSLVAGKGFANIRFTDCNGLYHRRVCKGFSRAIHIVCGRCRINAGNHISLDELELLAVDI